MLIWVLVVSRYFNRFLLCLVSYICQGLDYDGLGRLLGMAKTTGTVPDGLPPPSSTLLSSCMRLHQPNVRFNSYVFANSSEHLVLESYRISII